MLGAHGAGRFVGVDEMTAATVRPRRRVEPLAANVARHGQIPPKSLAIHPALKGAPRD
ncbi:hypothetical protein [Rubellimicrobium roseum]|uniref:hypothetical protein n=1 Tax=Rubellimicrobium roseum TaxID=687525 RepID=UPI001C3F3DD2|nr:hypothetical protein [Rubellimicrobium roseum]